jgi:NitT/TauT family transport system substrate-binding protein
MNNKTKKRSGLIALAVLLMAATLLSACGNGGGGQVKSASASSGGQGSGEAGAAQADAPKAKRDPVKVRFADILTNPVIRVAKTKGFFEQYGIDAEIVTFATPAEGINSLFIKQVDIAWGADFPVLNAVSKGDYSIVAATGTNTDASAAKWKLFVRDHIQSAADLKGKKLSTLRGTYQPYLWDEYLKENGIDVADTEMIGQGSMDEAYVALRKGEIDAAWVTGAAVLEKFYALEDVRELTDMSKTSVRIGGAIVAANEWIGKHPDALANVLTALDEASAFIDANPDETADILFKEVKQPKEATLQDLGTVNWKVGFTQASFDSLASQKKYMVDTGIIAEDFELKSKLHLDAIRQAKPDRVTYAE